MINSIFDGIIKIIDSVSEVIKNDKVLIPVLVFVIIIYDIYAFGLDSKEIVLTGLGYLAGATQGSKTHPSEITNGQSGGVK
jgi:hypothetical protein